MKLNPIFGGMSANLFLGGGDFVGSATLAAYKTETVGDRNLLSKDKTQFWSSAFQTCIHISPVTSLKVTIWRQSRLGDSNFWRDGKFGFFSIYNKNLVTKDTFIGVYFPLSVVQISHDVFDVKW